MSDLQTTISRPCEFEPAVALFSGALARMRCLPAPADHGIRFRRVDLPGAPEVPAHVAFLDTGHMARQTSLARGAARVGTTEHLLAACLGLGIDNLLVELDAAELPIFDGSALKIAQGLAAIGIERLEAPRRWLAVDRPRVFETGLVQITAMPCPDLHATFFAEFGHPAIGEQAASFAITPNVFLREIAPARTFATREEAQQLEREGRVQGGSIDCAVVFDDDGPMGATLRFANEPARHKLLDLLGDLCLAGRPLKGLITALRSGHRTHAAFVQELLKDMDNHDEQHRTGHGGPA